MQKKKNNNNQKSTVDLVRSHCNVQIEKGESSDDMTTIPDFPLGEAVMLSDAPP